MTEALTSDQWAFDPAIVWNCGNHFCNRYFKTDPGKKCPLCGEPQIRAVGGWRLPDFSGDGQCWTVEQLIDGFWKRAAQAQAWALETDARQQCEALRRMYENRIYRVAPIFTEGYAS
jgi:hypothetical protein